MGKHTEASLAKIKAISQVKCFIRELFFIPSSQADVHHSWCLHWRENTAAVKSGKTKA